MAGTVLIPQTEFSDQAESSSLNPVASSVRMRMLIELQVISHLLARQTGDSEDLRQLRFSIAADMMGVL